MSKSNKNDRLLQRAAELAIKNRNQTVGSFKTRPSGFYTADHVLFYISVGINMIIYLINFFAMMLKLEIDSAIDVAKITQFRNMSIIAVILLAISVITVVYKFGKDKCYLFAFTTLLLAVVPMTTLFLLGKETVELFNSPIKYFLMYFAPSIVSVGCLIHIGSIIFGEKRAINKKYDDILQAIYEQNKSDENQIMTAEEWDAAIDKYIDNPSGKEKQKRSLKNKSK